MGCFNMERKYRATVKVIKYHEIGFYSPDYKHALLDAETIAEDEDFRGDDVAETRTVVEVSHDE